jgi:GT2 family glycosyltransferase
MSPNTPPNTFPEEPGPATAEQTEPLASVIVLGWNGRRFLDDCLSSVFDQDLGAEYEVIYCDNGSKDGSVEYVSGRYPAARIVPLDKNHGYSEGNNIAFRHARGRYVVFLNQDVVVHRSWLRELIAGVTSAPDVMAAHANVIQSWYPEFKGIHERAASSVAYTAELSPLGYVRYHRLGAVSDPVEVLFLHGVSIIIPRSLGEQLDYIFDPEMFAYAEDMDLGLRVRALGYRCVIVPKAVVYHKHELKTALTWRTVKNTVRIVRNRYLAYYKVMSIPEFAMMSLLLTIGAPLNAGEFGLTWPKRIVYGVGLVPITAMALVETLWSLPAYSEKRRRVRGRAARRGPWSLKATLMGVK